LNKNLKKAEDIKIQGEKEKRQLLIELEEQLEINNKTEVNELILYLKRLNFIKEELKELETLKANFKPLTKDEFAKFKEEFIDKNKKEILEKLTYEIKHFFEICIKNEQLEEILEKFPDNKDFFRSLYNEEKSKINKIIELNKLLAEKESDIIIMNDEKNQMQLKKFKINNRY